MADVIVVASGLAGALFLAWLARVRAGPNLEAIDASGLLTGPGAVIFTKDDCPKCVDALALVEALDLPVRQIRAEDEPLLLGERGVGAVPLTVVVSRTGENCGQFGGVPSGRGLRQAVKRAGEIPDASPRAL